MILWLFLKALENNCYQKNCTQPAQQGIQVTCVGTTMIYYTDRLIGVKIFFVLFFSYRQQENRIEQHFIYL